MIDITVMAGLYSVSLARSMEEIKKTFAYYLDENNEDSHKTACSHHHKNS